MILPRWGRPVFFCLRQGSSGGLPTPSAASMANPNRCGTRGSVHFPAASRWRRQQRSSRICDGVPPMGQRTFLSPSPEAVWEPAAWPAFQTRLWNWSVPREGQRDEMDSIWKREFK
uniref:(northern house mosquito) hypothetical protein n=1 Tax=Culex pipiens TaxID=7175 RepID=A0A8D8AXQ3_CULPI